MPHLTLSEAQIFELTGWVATYISEQRALFLRKAVPIEASHKAVLQTFFPEDLLDDVRVVQGCVSEPSFYRELRGLGIENALPFSDMAGITFQNVVVHVELLALPLLFHELVHAVQYSRLGLRGFAEHYVRGFLSGGSYEEIPLEKQAYELEARFEANPGEQFSVDVDVQRRLKLKQL
jgi:hypothetical protein